MDKPFEWCPLGRQWIWDGLEVPGNSEEEGAVLRLGDTFNSKDSAEENLRVFYLLMLLFCGTRSLKPVVGSLQSPIQSS